MATSDQNTPENGDQYSDKFMTVVNDSILVDDMRELFILCLDELLVLMGSSQIAEEKVTYLVDESDYSLNEWARAVEYLYDHQSKRLEAPQNIDSVFAYLECCSEFAKQKGLQMPFTEVIGEMLEQYGFDAVRDE